jgi:hypothetical protein
MTGRRTGGVGMNALVMVREVGAGARGRHAWGWARDGHERGPSYRRCARGGAALYWRGSCARAVYIAIYRGRADSRRRCATRGWGQSQAVRNPTAKAGGWHGSPCWPILTSLSPARVGLRYRRMHRHQGVAPQPLALRSVVKQVYGVNTTSAADNQRKPPVLIGEGTITPARGGPQGYWKERPL